MIIATTQKASQVIGGVEIFSPMGLTILTIGILFTVGVPLTMILEERKIKLFSLTILWSMPNLLIDYFVQETFAIFLN